jgi:Co/Zn/Cd efflux system component
MIAVIGLGVNLLSAFPLRDNHVHDQGEANNRSHDHENDHVHRDHNLRAAFIHVVADAAVSVLVIVSLVAGRFFGWLWMDPIMGLLATVVILSWSWTLVRSGWCCSSRRLF